MAHFGKGAVFTSASSAVAEFDASFTLLELFHIFRMTATGGKMQSGNRSGSTVVLARPEVSPELRRCQSLSCLLSIQFSTARGRVLLGTSPPPRSTIELGSADPENWVR